MRRGKWGDAIETLERVLLEFSPGDRADSAGAVLSGRGQVRHRQPPRGRARIPAGLRRDARTIRSPPEALLRAGDVYADLWRRPELDPSYGQTALATYQELLNRYPDTTAAKRAQVRINELQERFAYKEYQAALFYFRLKAYDSAILYLKDLVATYPRAAIAPEALVKLVQAYRRSAIRRTSRRPADTSAGSIPPRSAAPTSVPPADTAGPPRRDESACSAGRSIRSTTAI